MLKLKVFADGRVLVDDAPVSLDELPRRFAEIAKTGEPIWYYREGAGSEPHPNAMKVIEMIVQHGLPITLSSKPDFSDYVDMSGVPRPR